MFELLLAGIIFNDMNVGNHASKERKRPEDKTVAEIDWFTCPHCTETYDVDYVEVDGVCPVCGLNVEEEYNDEDMEAFGNELTEVCVAIGQMKEALDSFTEQIAEINKRLKNLENK